MNIREKLVSIFRDGASVNMTEDAVARQAERFAEAILSMFDVREIGPCEQCSAHPGAEHHPECMYYVEPAPLRWEIGKNGWDASDHETREDI